MDINIGWPQAIYLFLLAANIGICLARYGEQKRDKYDINDTLVAPAIALGLLYWGGFFG